MRHPPNSIAGGLVTIIKRDPFSDDWRDDMTRGLNIIGGRAVSLAGFLGAYAKFAGIPRPGSSCMRQDYSHPGQIVIRWRFERWQLVVDIEDDGPGLAATANLFVPFFTTKPGGSGIRLVLCRQLIEAHGGFLSLTNRESARGCVERLQLPCLTPPEVR